MKIGVDLDDVLSQSTPALIKFHNNTYGTSLKIKDLKTYIWETWSETLKEALQKIEDFHKTPYFKNIKPIKGAKEVLEKLKKNNEIYIITARGDDIKKATEKWVENHFPNTFSKIYFTDEFLQENAEVTKGTVCNSIGIDVFIEDNLEYALECAGPNRKVYLLDYPWNQTDELPEGVKRVYSWKEIGELASNY